MSCSQRRTKHTQTDRYKKLTKHQLKPEQKFPIAYYSENTQQSEQRENNARYKRKKIQKPQIKKNPAESQLVS